MSEDGALTYALKIRLSGLVSGWGLFTLFILFPLIIAAAFYFSNIFFFLIYAIILFVFLMIMVTWKIIIMKSRPDFWLDAEILESVFDTLYPLFSGYVLTGFLFCWLYFIAFGFLLFPMITFIFLTMAPIPLFYYLLRYFEQRSKGMRYKSARGKIEDIEEIVRKALDSLNLKYSRTIEGSRWTMLITSYQLEDLGISVELKKVSEIRVFIATKVQSDLDVPKAREIEKTIDSLISISDF